MSNGKWPTVPQSAFEKLSAELETTRAENKALKIEVDAKEKELREWYKFRRVDHEELTKLAQHLRAHIQRYGGGTYTPLLAEADRILDKAQEAKRE